MKRDVAPLRRASRVPDSAAGIPPAAPWIDLRLDGNQGRAPSQAFLDRLERDPELVRRYPMDRALEELLAARHGVTADRIFVGAGADDVLDRLCRALLEPGREAVLPVPTFEMLERYVALSGAAVVRVPWDEGPWPRERVLAAVTDATSLLAIVSPNNPTGLVASADDVRAACSAAKHTCVLVDAAYAEFGGEDLTAAALAFRNTVVTRTFSKAFGLAGLRVGYAIAPPDVVSWLRAVGSPFTCGTWSRAIACDRLENGAREVDDYVQTAARERGQLFEHAARLGLRPLPSAANFVLVRAPDPAWLRDACSGLGIAVRAFPVGVRITLPAERAAFERLLAALDAAVAPEAFLLDLDGVLADIEGRCALARPEDVEALAAMHPIGVVTSCPRRLAESILQRHGFLPHVRALVTAEDGPGKPDPAPVRLALQRLSVRAAWMLGDNPPDVFAARGAGVVPLAVASSPESAERLRACGASRIVDGLPGLRELARQLPR